jgi:CHAT domain-containing protein
LARAWTKSLTRSVQTAEQFVILSDGHLDMSHIMHILVVAHTHMMKNSMKLAFLSACETAKGDANTPDEAMHLAASLLFAGFGGVVATMW